MREARLWGGGGSGHTQLQREREAAYGGGGCSTAGAPGVKGPEAKRQAAGAAHWVGAGDSASLGLGPARLRPLGILRPPWRQLPTPAQT